MGAWDAVAAGPWRATRGRTASGAQAVLEALWNAPYPIAILDRDLRLVRINPLMAGMFGAALDEQGGRPAEELFGPLARSPEVRRALDEGVPTAAGPLELEWPRGSGDRRSWLATVQPVRAKAGEVISACVLLTEVTGWRRAEEAAQEARGEAELAIQALIRLQAVTASLASALTPAHVARVVTEQGIGLLDASAGSISWAVGRDELEVLDAFGYPEESLVAWRRYGADTPSPLADAFRTGQPVWLESPAEHAARYPHLNAAHHPFHGASAAVPLVVAEQVVGVLGMDFDAPRRFDAADRSVILAIAHQTAEALSRARLYEQQQALRAEAERTAALLDTMFSSVPIGLAFVDWDLRLVHVNSALGRLLGKMPAACVGKLVADALPGEEGAARVGRWRQVLASGEPVLDLEEQRGEPDDPHKRTWLESCYPVVAGGDTIGLAVVAREITSARRAEEFRRNLLGIVGHDLRNPLSAISGFAHVLRKAGGLDERQVRTVTRIDECALKAARIAHDLLDLTRVESARGIPIEPRAARADEICGGVVAEAETAFPGRRLRIRGRGNPAVRWDPERMSQALSNLVVNALKHGAPDEPVTIEWDGMGDPVSVRVHNLGTPIPAAVRAHLFEPFRQGAQGGARASGVGLGLFIAHEIARAHGGSLDVRSDEGEGTSFTLRLPREAAR
jgi:PAS domain S-box-containing protein